MRKNTGLCVCFYNGANPEQEQLLKASYTAVLSNFSRVIGMATPRDMIGGGFDGSPRVHIRQNPYFTHTVNGDNQAKALEYAQEGSRGSPIVVVSLCQEMIKAAADKGLPVITCGAPKPSNQPATSGKQVWAATPDHIPGLIRMMDRGLL